jgi:hypothetical protein
LSRVAHAPASPGLASLLLMLALGGCGEQLPQVPEAPAMLISSAEYPFGDTIAAADAAAIGHVADVLTPRYGKPEVTRYIAPASADLRQLKSYYDAGADAGGWRPIGEVDGALSPGENAVAYRVGDAAFAVVWLTPRAASAATPVSVLRFAR